MSYRGIDTHSHRSRAALRRGGRPPDCSNRPPKTFGCGVPLVTLSVRSFLHRFGSVLFWPTLYHDTPGIVAYEYDKRRPSRPSGD